MRLPHSVLPFAVLFGLAAFPVAAQRPFGLENLRQLVGVGGVVLAPDGGTAVITVTRPSFERNANESELYAVDVASGAQRQLTYGRRVVANASFAPDGRSLAFLSPDSAGKMQIWVLPMAGRAGEARRVTSHPTGVEHFSWRPDGGALAFGAADPAPKREGEDRFLTTFTVRDQDLFLRENLQPQHIWLVDLAGGAPRRLTSGSWTLEFVLPPGSAPSGLSWSPDGRTIAFVQAVAPESGKLDSVRIQLLDVASGNLTPLTSARTFETNPVFSPDGRLVAYWYPREGRGDLSWENEIWVAPASGGAPRTLTRALDRNLFGAQWMPGGKALLVAGNDGTSVGVWIQPLEGAAQKLALGDLVVNGAFGYDVTVAQQRPVIAFTATTPSRPSELYVMDSPTAAPRKLTSFNDWISGVSLGRMERVTWKSEAFQSDGVLAYPPNFDPSRKYPLVLLIHGGPTASSKLSFSTLAQLMAAEGWIVFQPNYRGSDNLGHDYEVAIVGDAGPGPGRDVMAGVAMLRSRPYVDRTRTAVTGWSYGGYMTSWLIGNYPTEWTSAMAGAPVTDFEDQYNFGDGSVTWRHFQGGKSPWLGDQELYRKQSPITYATRAKTPTLIMSNMEDFRVPPTQAFKLYRALKDNGVETQFIGFKGRTHASGDPVNARERNRLWVDWVKRHFQGAPVP
jgi:dipeptidyl aminopeptidase/acylaminoacyl peptidase